MEGVVVSEAEGLRVHLPAVREGGSLPSASCPIPVNTWFDTTEADLECICRECHERHHGIQKAPKPLPRPAPVVATQSGLVFTQIKDVNRARSHHKISREEFEFLEAKAGRCQHSQESKAWEPETGCFGVESSRRMGSSAAG